MSASSKGSTLSEYDKLVEALNYVRAELGPEAASKEPQIGLICGSGMGDLVKALTQTQTISYSTIPHLAPSTVAGHSGELVFGRLNSHTSLVVMRGRVHLYEGYNVVECVRPVRLMAMLGIKILCITNAAGNLNGAFQPGDLMIVKDHISFPCLAGENPLRGVHEPRLGERFVSMWNAYDPELIRLLEEAGLDCKLSPRLRKGVYAMVVGPNYESVAEARALKTLGADAIGMSTVHEVIAARQMGVRCAAVSLMTNDVQLDYDPTEPTCIEHDGVIGKAAESMRELTGLIKAFVSSLDLSLG